MISQVKRLTQALIVSGILNIGLISLFFYWMVKETPPIPYLQLKPATDIEQIEPLADDRSSEEVINQFKRMPFEQLIAKLGNRQQVENGYTQHDLALGILVATHHFDLTRALTGLPMPSQMRILYKAKSPEENDIIAYPEMSDLQNRAIVNFASIEKWPLTSEGLFLASKKPQKHNVSLAEAFYVTPEFLAAQALFARAEGSITKKQLQDILVDGNWEMLHEFTEQQRVSQDISPARRQKFLLDYMNKGSKNAALMLLKTDANFAAKKLDDPTILNLLSLISEKSTEAQNFALEIARSPRSDKVKDRAVARLYEYSSGVKEIIPQKKTVAPKKEEKLLPLAYTPTPPKTLGVLPPIKEKPEQIYVVQKGDSLWTIAKKYHTNTVTLREYNHLKSDTLRPGSVLKIPLTPPSSDF